MSDVRYLCPACRTEPGVQTAPVGSYATKFPPFHGRGHLECLPHRAARPDARLVPEMEDGACRGGGLPPILA